ncbi:MAG: hypothetical protein ACE5EO_00550 [Candidatus Krumholzibacteriia bacterium]
MTSSDTLRDEFPDGRRGPVRALLASTLVLTAVTFLPVLVLFFAQDDFMLMQRAVNEPGWGFAFTKHHYRPLTKYLYFAVMYAAFGLKPFAYHLVSLLVHVANTWLVFKVIGRLGVRRLPAVLASALFGMNVAFLNAVAWVACIQQLAGTLFFLTCLWTGIRAVQERSRPLGFVSALAYVLAVLSLEQTFAAGPLLVVLAALGIGGRRRSPSEILRTLWPHVLVFSVYTLARVFKGVPDSGYAGFAYGRNVLENLAAYLGAMTNPWPAVSNRITAAPLAPRVTHVILVALVGYHLVRRRVTPVVFAGAFVLATLFPTLFLREHEFYYHTYPAALGVFYLSALALSDLFRIRALRAPRARVVTASVLVAGLFGTSLVSVHTQLRRASDPRVWADASFVIRRSRLGRTIHDDIVSKVGNGQGIRTVHMVYYDWQQVDTGGRKRDLFWALGNGALVAMALGDPSINVVLEPDRQWISRGESPGTRVLMVDREGHVYTLSEVRGRSR